MSHLVGSIKEGCLADLVIWEPATFGVRPLTVIKGGFIAWAAMGDANASIPTVQPVIGRPMFGYYDTSQTSICWVSQASVDNGKIKSYGLKKMIEPVKGCRNLSKKDMKLNDVTPQMTVDPETYLVHADGVLCDVPPATHLPLTTSQFLY